MQPSIGRWLWNTIALPVCAGYPNLANSTSAWKKNSGRLRTMRSGCTGRVPGCERSAGRQVADWSCPAALSQRIVELAFCRLPLLADAWLDTTTAHGAADADGARWASSLTGTSPLGARHSDRPD